MTIEVLKSKLHGATVTDANLRYEGSVSIDPLLYKKAGMFLNEKVNIYNVTTGGRFSTYIIKGKPGEICLNGAAARLAEVDDTLIIVSYGSIDVKEAEKWEPNIVILGPNNTVKK